MLATITGTGNGTAPVVDLTFPFIDKAHVKASVNGAPVTFTWTGTSQVTFDAAVDLGLAWKVYRETPTNPPVVDFTNGAVLTEADLDLAETSHNYRDEELDDLISGGGDNLTAETANREAADTALSDRITAVAGDISSNALASLSVPADGIGGIYPEQFGAKGDGVTNDTAAFQQVANFINTAGGGAIYLRAGATYIVGKQDLVNNGTKIWSGEDVLYLHNNTRRIVIRGNGAKIKFADGLKYGTFDAAGNATTETAPYTGPEATSLIDNLGGIITLSENTGGVSIFDLELDGNMSGLNIGGPAAADGSGYQLGGDGIMGQYNTGGVHLSNVHAHHFPRDGALIAGVSLADYGSTGDNRARYPHTIEDSIFEENGRNNFSLSGGRGFYFRNVNFIKNPANQPYPVSSGPDSSCDIEAEFGSIRDVQFESCWFVGGATSIVIGSGDTEGIRFNNCKFENAAAYAAWLEEPGIVAENCKFFGGVLYGDPTDLSKAGRFINCHFTDNPADSTIGPMTFNVALFEGAGGGAHGNKVLFDRCTWDGGRAINGPAIHGSIFQDCTITLAGTAAGGVSFQGAEVRGHNIVTQTAGWFGLGTPTKTYGGDVVVNGVPWFSATATYDPANLSNNSGVTTTIAVPGAQLGQHVDVTFSNDLQGVSLYGWVSAVGTVSVRFQNTSGGAVDLASGTITVRVRDIEEPVT